MCRRQILFALSALVCAAGLAAGVFTVRPAAAQSTSAAAGDPGDPWEGTNRSIFEFNQGIDKAVLVPAANVYRVVLPSPVRDGVHDFLQNLNSPIIFANDLLQGQLGLANDTFARFLMNTTFGIGGIVDIAGKAGIPYHTNDLGITLATWGVSDGPYLMIPVLGPSNPRDLVGDTADGFGDPGTIVAGNYHKLYAVFARAAAAGIDERSRNIESLAEIERTSLDYYATIRSLARQRRAAQIHHQKEDVPNTAPLQGANTRPAPMPPRAIAELPSSPTPAMNYRLMPPSAPARSLADLQSSPMTAAR